MDDDIGGDWEEQKQQEPQEDEEEIVSYRRSEPEEVIEETEEVSDFVRNEVICSAFFTASQNAFELYNFKHFKEVVHTKKGFISVNYEIFKLNNSASYFFLVFFRLVLIISFY